MPAISRKGGTHTKYRVTVCYQGKAFYVHDFPYLDAQSDSAEGYVRLFKVAIGLKHWDESEYSFDITEVPDDNE